LVLVGSLVFLLRVVMRLARESTEATKATKAAASN